jgi:hypothetical protein
MDRSGHRTIELANQEEARLNGLENLALSSNDSGLSKATAAQYLACILQSRHKRRRMTAESLRTILPTYIVAAIEYVTLPPEQGTTREEASKAGTVA